MSKLLEVSHMTVRYGSMTIVNDISFSVEPGQWLMIVGPNGAGKTTIVSAISQGAPYTGSVRYEGTDVKKIKSRELARNIGVLTQNHYVGYGFTVEEIIRLGRYAHGSGVLSDGSGSGEDKVQEAIDKTGLRPYLNQSVLTLSGGELQRTFLAQLFAQDPKLLMLDEPTNHLDLIYQKQVFSLVQDWLRTSGGAVLSVVHDLSLARAYGTHAILMERGRIAASGPVEEVMDPGHLNEVYSMDVYRWMQEMYGQWNSPYGDERSGQ